MTSKLEPQAGVSKIIFITDRLALGGAELHTYLLANSLSKRGYECSLLTYKANDDSIDHRLFHPQEKLKPEALNAVPLLKLLLKQAPDILVVTSQRALHWLSWFSWLLPSSVKIVAIIHNMPPQPRPLLGFWRTRKYFRKKTADVMTLRMMNRCHSVVFPSHAQSASWISHGFAPDRIEVIGNGIDLKQFNGAVARTHANSARQQFGFSEDDIVIGTCSRLSFDKRLDLFLLLVAQLRQTNPKIKALIVGDGPRAGPLKHLAHQLYLSEHVVFTGLIADTSFSTAAMDIGILTSLSEVFGLFACECMAMGRPMLMARAGGSGDVIDHGETGALFSAGKVESMASEIQPFLDRDVRHKVGNHAASVALRRFCGEEMVKKYDALFARLRQTI